MGGHVSYIDYIYFYKVVDEVFWSKKEKKNYKLYKQTCYFNCKFVTLEFFKVLGIHMEGKKKL